jgi:hypothetical protein
MPRLYLAAAAFLAVMGLATVLGSGPRYPEIIGLVMLIFGGAMLDPDEWRKALWAMLWLSVAIAYLAMFQAGIGFPRSRGPFVSPNFLAGYAAMHFMLALFFARPGRLIWIIPALANGVSLYLAYSRAGLLAWSAGMAIVLIRSGWRALAALGVATLGALAIVWQYTRPDFMHEARWAIWSNGLHAVSLRPILGWGPGGFAIPPHFDRFYNSAIDTLLAGGAIGLAAGIWLLMEGARTTRRAPETERLALLGLFAAWTVNSLFTYETIATAVPLFIVLGYLASVDRHISNAARLIDDSEARMSRAAAVGNTRPSQAVR